MKNKINNILAIMYNKAIDKKGKDTVIYVDRQTRLVHSCTEAEWEHVFSKITVTEIDGIKKKYMRIKTMPNNERTDFEFQFAKAINDFGEDKFEMVQYLPNKWTSKIKI